MSKKCRELEKYREMALDIIERGLVISQKLQIKIEQAVDGEIPEEESRAIFGKSPNFANMNDKISRVVIMLLEMYQRIEPWGTDRRELYDYKQQDIDDIKDYVRKQVTTVITTNGDSEKTKDEVWSVLESVFFSTEPSEKALL